MTEASYASDYEPSLCRPLSQKKAYVLFLILIVIWVGLTWSVLP